MKNINNLIIVITIVIFTACGPSAKEKEKFYNEKVKSEAKAGNDSTTDSNTVDLKSKTPKNRQFIKTAEIKFKVNNVRKSSELIEDLAVKYGGYITSSDLKNEETNINRYQIYRDSILVSRQITVLNLMNLRIPNEKLDSFTRSLNKIILFLDYRKYKLDDVTLSLVRNKKLSERFKEYNKRQSNNIDSKKDKLKDKSNVEESILQKNIQSDEVDLENTAIEDNVKYCDISLYIYQKPVTFRETIEDFDYIADKKPSFSRRVSDSFIEGWKILINVFVFLIRIWWLILIIVFSIITYRKPIFKNKK